MTEKEAIEKYKQDRNLREAHLRRTDLSWTDLSGADLSEADLRGADLRGADLRWTNLSGADLREADLRWTNLSWADLSEANIDGCKGIWEHSIVPQVGCFHGFKKLINGQICELIIGKNARRVGGLTGRKCRAEYAKVLSGSGFSAYDKKFKYAPGEVVRAENFDPDPRVECSGGIHFFLTREEAENY